MKTKLLFLTILFLFSALSLSFAQSEIRYVRGYDTREYDVLFNPYPMAIDEDVAIRVFAPFNPLSVTYVFNKTAKFSLKKEGNYWRGIVKPPKEMNEGWNLSFVFITYKRGELDREARKKALAFFQKMFAAVKLTDYKDYVMIEGKIWIRAFKEPQAAGKLVRIAPPPVTIEGTAVGQEIAILPVSGEASTGEAAVIAASPEVLATPEVQTGLKVKGSKSINFVTRSIEGSKEGFASGYTREESLRFNIAGKLDSETDVDANFISTSTSGNSTTSQNEDKVSVLIRRASTEVYYGDFIGDLNETEFGTLNKSLSGVKVTGNYDQWGFKALYSTPRGDPKYFKSYGDGTQGPFNLGNAPVVVDSDRVYLNGVEQTRGDDYTIDYQAGTITFRRGIVLKTWIIEAYYDYRETLFQHATVGLRYKQKVSDDLKLGFTFIDDSDQLYKADEIRETLSNTIEPQSHYLVDFDGSGRLWNTQFNSELAYSNKDLNILEPGENRSVGKAFKLDTSTDQGPFSLQTNYKRVGPTFSAIADASPKQDVWQDGAKLGYRPSGTYYASAGYGHDQYVLSDTKYLTTDKNFESKWTPQDIPSLNYFYRETFDSNDPVYTDEISRLTTKHDAESSYRYGWLLSTVRGGLEERVNHEPSKEVTTYKTVNFGTATYGLEKVSVSGNVELKDTVLPDKTTPYTKTYNANASVTPNSNYFGSLSLQVVDDSVDGMTNVTDLNYRASPAKNFSTDGKYTIQSIKEDFGGTPEGVTKQTGSFRFDVLPSETVRLRYYYKPSFTRVESANSYSYNDLTTQSEITHTPVRELSTSLIYKTGDTMNIDRTDPRFKREANHRYTYDSTFLVNSAPLRFLSLQFLYNTSDLDLTEQTIAGATTYDGTLGNTKKYEVSAKTALNERFSIDSSYSYQNQYQSSSLGTSNIDTVSQTLYGKGLWNYDDNWTYFASYSYTESIDHLLTADNITYTKAPGGGITYRFLQILRIDLEYIRSSSYAASDTEVDTYTLKTKYDPNEYVHINLRGTREISINPDYKTSEILGGLEIVL